MENTILKDSSKVVTKFVKSIFLTLLSVNGIIITLLLGLIINLTSSNIEGQIQRQRYLELLQLEITRIALQARAESKEYNDTGVILNYAPYDTSVYNSGLENGYILTLDPDVLAQIYIFYVQYIPGINSLTSGFQKVRTDYNEEWQKCTIQLDQKNKPNCDNELQLKNSADKLYSELMKEASTDVEANALEILKTYKPTQSRLNSFYLKYIMGNKSLESLR